MSFDAQRVLILLKFSLSVFSLLACNFGVRNRPPVFPSQTVMASALQFRSRIHVELICVGVNKGSSLTCLHVDLSKGGLPSPEGSW